MHTGTRLFRSLIRFVDQQCSRTYSSSIKRQNMTSDRIKSINEHRSEVTSDRSQFAVVPEQVNELTNAMQHYADRCRRKFCALYPDAMRLILTLESAIRHNYKFALFDVIPVGSLVTELWSSNASDIDVVLFPTNSTANAHDCSRLMQQLLNDNEFLCTYFNDVNRHLRNHPNVFTAYIDDEGGYTIVPLNGGRTNTADRLIRHPPLISIQLRNLIGTPIEQIRSIDIQLCNEHAVRNSLLIRYYAMADPRFVPLCLFTKRWFANIGINDSKRGFLSSYHITLLVIHFLQSTEALDQPVLPVLCRNYANLIGPQLPIGTVIERLRECRHVYPTAQQERLRGWKSANKMSTGELALKMIAYYSSKGADFERTEFRIATGDTRQIQPLTGRARGTLQLIDPYCPVPVVRGNRTAFEPMYAIRKQADKLRNVDGLLSLIKTCS